MADATTRESKGDADRGKLLFRQLNCATCHSTNGWTPSTFNHNTWFPIASGRHQFPCASCHVSAGNFNNFECILCHEHSQSNTNSHHQGVGGYVYESHACYQCHPRGSS